MPLIVRRLRKDELLYMPLELIIKYGKVFVKVFVKVQNLS